MNDQISSKQPNDPLLGYRNQFPILEKTVYLISNSLGAVPQQVEQSLQNYYETWASRGVRAWEETWWKLSSVLGDDVAPLIGAGLGETTFLPSVTVAHAVLFSAFDYGDHRPKIVTDAMHFPSILYLIDQQSRLGAEVVTVPSIDGLTVDAGQIIDAIDDQTAFVAISHVLFKSAFIQDLRSIASKAREVGAVLIADGYQAVGTIPVNVRDLGVDVYIGGCLKWLCGGPGTAFVWVHPDQVATLEPKLTGWMADQHPFAFNRTLERRDDTWRFLIGTPSIPSLYAARPGLAIIRGAGIEAIRAKSIRQTTRLLELADEAGLPCTTPRDPERRGGTVAIDLTEGLGVSRALKAREILCDYRPGAGIRLSPHFYNGDDELELAIRTVLEILETKEWEAYSVAATAVT